MEGGRDGKGPLGAGPALPQGRALLRQPLGAGETCQVLTVSPLYASSHRLCSPGALDTVRASFSVLRLGVGNHQAHSSGLGGGGLSPKASSLTVAPQPGGRGGSASPGGLQGAWRRGRSLGAPLSPTGLALLGRSGARKLQPGPASNRPRCDPGAVCPPPSGPRLGAASSTPRPSPMPRLL